MIRRGLSRGCHGRGRHAFPIARLYVLLLALLAQSAMARSQSTDSAKATASDRENPQASALSRDDPAFATSHYLRNGEYSALPTGCGRSGGAAIKSEGRGSTFSESDSARVEPVPPTVVQAGSGSMLGAERHTSDDRSIEWGGLAADSIKFLLFQHMFRLATEKDTRAGLSGPFFRDYKDGILNIHGWNDGDPFFVNYIDHPLEGSVAGFLEIAHDPRYNRLEIGKSSAYWKSRLRATAFSAAFSLQFEIGPLSEASIGNIQRSNAKAGVVDMVITPVVGLGWMLGEDALDKFLVARWETSTNSHLKRILLRGVLNPSRSFANMVQGKVPWHRDSRPGVSHF